MKQLGAVLIAAMMVLMTACSSGNNNSTTDVSGNWTATLTSGNGSSTDAIFTITLVQNSAGVVSGTNLNFTSGGSCFSSGSTVAGNFSTTGATGVQSGTLNLSISTGSNQALPNLLVMAGTVTSGNTITGTWNFTGTPSCLNGSTAGAFNMTRS